VVNRRGSLRSTPWDEDRGRRRGGCRCRLVCSCSGGAYIRPDSGRVAVFAVTRLLVVVDDVKAEAEVRADLIGNLRHRGDYVPPPQPSAALVRAEIILRSV